MALKFKRGQIVFTNLPDPVLKDPNAKSHPFLILSPETINNIEQDNPHYLSVMLSHSGPRNKFSYEIEPIHLLKKVKASSFAKLHLIFSIPQSAILSIDNQIEEEIVDLICTEIAIRVLNVNI